MLYSEQTHQHPLGFLPAGLLTVLLYKLLPLTPTQAKDNIDNIVSEALSVLNVIRVGKYEEDKQYLRKLTKKALWGMYDYFGQKGMLEYDEQEVERLKVLAKRTF